MIRFRSDPPLPKMPTIACSLLLQPLSSITPSRISLFLRNPHSLAFLKPSKTLRLSETFPITFAGTESDAPKSLQPDPYTLLQQLADSFDLPPDYFDSFPDYLRLDLNDAAFDLSSGPVLDECGQELGETLLDLSRAWQLADASTSRALVKKLPQLWGSLSDNAKSALGRRLVSAGSRFQPMGEYGQGELQKIAKLMDRTGRILSATSISTTSVENTQEENRVLKFGDFQFEVTPSKANIGAAIGFGFGILSWSIAQSLQSMPENSFQYANDNALPLAKSLRGTLLALFYASAFLSGLTSVGLIILGRQLNSEEK